MTDSSEPGIPAVQAAYGLESKPLPTYEVPPSVDDEVVLTIRIRVCTFDVRDGVARGLYRLLPTFEEQVRPLLDPDSMDSSIAGIEVALPDFKPYSYTRREVLPPIPEQP
jgi:hypothetical protein